MSGGLGGVEVVSDEEWGVLGWVIFSHLFHDDQEPLALYKLLYQRQWVRRMSGGLDGVEVVSDDVWGVLGRICFHLFHAIADYNEEGWVIYKLQ